MADENIVTNIVANADFSGLIADVNKVTASLAKLQTQVIQSDARLASQVATMNRSFGENLRRTGQFSTHFVTLTSDVEKFGTNLDKGQMKLKQYFQTFQQHTKTQGGLIRELAKQQVALQNAVMQPLGKNAQGLMQYSVHIPQGLDAIKNKTALAKQELQIMNKVIQDGGVQMINWGKNTQWAGRQLTVGLTVPLAAFGKAAADSFRAADAELTRLTKVYGGIAATSSVELSKIRNEVSATAKEISKAYGVSFKDTITLAADIAATGKQGNDLLASVKETSRLAVLGEVDRQDAMKATLAIQNTFKQNTDQLSESINFLNAVENQTSTSLADLIEAIPKAGPVIQGMGGSVKDLALYLTAMKEGGVNAAEGANALKSALASLINPTKVASEKFASMGIDLGGIVTKNAGNLTGTILELQKALDNLDPLQKQQAIEQLFGKFQFARMNALFSNLGKQGSQTLQVMDLMKASSQELAGVAGRELSMVTESASGKYRRALEGLKADLASMGEEFLKVQTFFINVTDGILKFINKLPAPVKSILTFVTGLTAIIGPIIMLTGVLANFFGYIIKGASHFKSLFKGGEGWKMLTPEILAAQKAGSLVEQTFYSDAKAATVLKTAIAGLVTEFEILQSKAMTGAVSAGPMISTVAGNVVAPGSAGRVVNPNHPLISPEDTRSMSHLNPVAGMTTDARAAQTIFGVVPGAPKVNQKIGNNPQMYMSGDLPKIQGLTSIGGASTGIVAEEAAKWHAMTGALAMQSEAEIALLKKEVSTTGLITTELSDSYQALLPTMTKLTANAATESAAIVAELQAGKITVDQARLKIVQLNAQVESMIAQASTDIAGQQGRSIGLTTVPLLNQPVVNKDGKTNMKELTRPGRTRDLLNKIARGLGVKTFGAGYSTETTIPRRLNSGGYIYTANDGSIVPGPNVNADVVPAMLTPGEFVVNAKATKENLPLLQSINGRGGNGPGYNFGSSKEIKNEYSGRELAHLTEMLYTKDFNADKTARLMREFGVNYDDVKSPTGRVGSSLTAAYHSFFNQGTNYGNLDIQKAIDYLEGKAVMDPQNGMVVHDPKLAYKAMMLDLGLSESEMKSFASRMDKKIISDLKRSQKAGALYLADSPTNPTQAGTSGIGRSVEDYVNSVGNPSMTQALKGLKANGEFRVHRQGKSSSDRYFPKATSKVSTMLAAIVAKKRMPQKLPNLLNIFPKTGKVFQLPERDIVSEGMNSRMSYNRRLYKRNQGGIIGYNRGGQVAAALQILSHSPINKLSQLTNYLKARRMVKQGMFHGSYGENTPALEGRNVLDSAISRDKFHGMGFYSTSSIKEAERYSEGYNTTMDGGFGTVNQIMNVPKGQYIDFRKKNLKWQNIQLYKALGGKDYKYAGEDLGPILRQLGIKGAIMPRISAGRTSDKQQDLAEWLSWADPSGVVTKELLGKLPEGRIPGRANGGPVNAGQPYMVGERGPELFVPRNSGGIIPRYHDGGIAGLRSKIRGTGTVPGMNGGLDSGTASMAGFGVMAGGQMMGGTLGMGMQFAGMAMQMAPLLKMLKPLVSGFGSVGSSITKIGTIAKTVFTAMRIALAALLTPAGAVIAVVTALGLAIYKNNERLKENAKEQTMLHSVTKKGAEQAGISYNNISDSIKNVKDQLELARASAENAFNAQNSSGVAGLTLTIKELQDKIKSAKTEMSEFVDVLNKMDQGAEKNNKMAMDLAANWKATWVAGGKSAQDATNEIYAIVKASNMANHAFEAITSGGFKSITDRASALSYMFEDLNKNMSKMSGEDLGNALGNLVTGLDSAVNALAGTKDESGKQIGYAKAMEETLKNINSIESANTKLKQDQIEDLKKTHPQLAKILNTSDTIKSVYAKWKILTEGVNVNLKNLTASEAEALAKFINLENKIISASEKGMGVVKSLGKSGLEIENLNRAIAAGGANAAKAAAKTKDDLDAEIKLIDKRMKKYQEEADARIKAIQKTQDAESYAVELKQSQLDLQAAIATGDKEAQVRAGLALAALQKRHESEMAISSIQDDVAAKDKANNEEKQRIQDAKDKLDKKTTVSQNKAADVTVIRDKILDIQTQYEAILKRKTDNKAKGATDPTKGPEALTISKDLSTLAASVAKLAAGKDKDLTESLKNAFAGTLIDSKTLVSLGGKTIEGPDGKGKYQTGDADKVLASDSTKMLDELVSIDSHLANMEKIFKGTGSGTSADPYQNGGLGDIYKANPSFKPKIGGALNPGLDPSRWNQPGYGGLLGAASARSQIKKYAEEMGFKPKQYFTIDHNNLKYKFRVEKDGNITMIGKPVAIKKSLGGPFAAGQLIEINDRINPLGAQMEGMGTFIKPDFSGVIYPNAATMPKYDIPSGGYRGSSSMSSATSGGAAPVINNYITASPNMDIKQLAREVGMVTAKAVSRGGNNRGYSNGTQQVVNI